AGADRLAPDELLPAVDHRREVDPDVGVENRRAEGGRAVDDGEHRRGDDVAKPCLSGSFAVVVDRLGLADSVRVLADLLEPDLVGRLRVLLAARLGSDWHRAPRGSGPADLRAAGDRLDAVVVEADQRLVAA